MEKTTADQVIACRLTVFERRLLEALADRERVSMSAIVRDAVLKRVRENLEHERDPRPSPA